ncbi:SPOR domain-containing protein [Oligella ureolytica]|jgi:DedD protein|nr:SPOR domain-containing protein [Alcaligenaceae bacterium]HZJ98004.1 SPOR domain-containing protein [Oligella sp.]
MALFGSDKNQRPSAQYEQKRSNSRQQQRYQNEREMREQRVRSRNRLIGSVILVLAAIIILPLILKTGDDTSKNTITSAPLIAPGSSIGQSGLVVESSPGVQTPQNAEEFESLAETQAEGLSIAEGGLLLDEDDQSPLAVDDSLPEGEDDAAQGVSSGVSIAESTAEASAVAAAEARERAEREAAAAKERTRQEQARAAAAKAEQQKKQQQAAASNKRTDDGSKALAILEGKTPPPAASAPAPAASSSGEFSLQVASYSSANDARSQRDRLRSSGVSNAYVQSATVNGNQVFRLRVGPFSTKEAAQAAQTRLRALNFSDSFVTGR